MAFTIERVEILLLVAAIVAMLARRAHVPYSIGLVLAGFGIALIPFAPNIQLTRELIFTAFLPALIFEAALYIHWRDLRKDLPVILVLATAGVVLSAAATTVGMRYLAGWEWSGALVFGVLIAATDPVSVIAIFKEAGASGRIRLLVEAESLFNDCTAAVAFTIVVLFASGQGVGVAGGLKTLGIGVAGGLLCGAVVAGVALLLVGRTNDHLVEITFTVVAAYGSFLLAEHFHASGVLATVTAGIIVGNVGHLAISAKARQAVDGFWEYAAFIANSLIFLLIGMHVAHQDFRSVLIPSLIAMVLVTLSRAAAVYPLSLLFSRSRLKIKLNHQHILFWGGLRGALALALALGLPPEMPHRDEIITVAFAVVAFSILAQGLTIKPLMRKLRELPTK